MSKAGRGLETKSVWHMILPSIRFREEEAKPLKMKGSISGVKIKGFSLFYGCILDDTIGLRVEILNKAVIHSTPPSNWLRYK